MASSIIQEGQILSGRYRLNRRLGQGGMGAVFAASDASLGRWVAIKLLTQTSTELRSRFAREAAILSRLESPHTLKVFDFGFAGDGTPFLVSELLRGRPLDALLRERGRLSERMTLHVLHGVSEALTEAHAAGVVHRDVKPANIFISLVADRSHVKLIDFGIAHAAAKPVLTQAGYFLGTPGYMAPEQVGAGASGPSSDVYALGVVAYECLAGTPPFEASTIPSLIYAHASELPLPLSARPDPVDVDPELEALVLQMLAKRPDDRPADGRAVRERVEAIQARHSRASIAGAPTQLDLELRAWAAQVEEVRAQPADAKAASPPTTGPRPRALTSRTHGPTADPSESHALASPGVTRAPALRAGPPSPVEPVPEDGGGSGSSTRGISLAAVGLLLAALLGGAWHVAESSTASLAAETPSGDPPPLSPAPLAPEPVPSESPAAPKPTEIHEKKAPAPRPRPDRRADMDDFKTDY